MVLFCSMWFKIVGNKKLWTLKQTLLWPLTCSNKHIYTSSKNFSQGGKPVVLFSPVWFEAVGIKRLNEDANCVLALHIGHAVTKMHITLLL